MQHLKRLTGFAFSEIPKIWSRLFPNRQRALDKRRLEHILQDEGMSRSVSRRIVQRYFSGSLTIHRG